MRRSRAFGIVAIVAAGATLLAGCAEATSNAPGGQAAAAGLQWASFDENDVCTAERAGTGGVFNAQVYQEGTGFDPVLNQTSQMAGAQVYGTLMRYDHTTGDYVPFYAQSLESNDSADEWTLKLDPRGIYSDGTRLDAAAVKKSVDRFRDPARANQFSTQIATVTDVRVVDDWTVVFALNGPWGTFPWLLTQPPGQIVNPKVLDTVPSEQLAKSPPPEAGAGAFQVTSYEPGTAMQLTAKKDWWRGPICLSGARITWSADGQGNYQATRAGQVDSFVTFDAPALISANGDDSMRTFQLEGVASTYHYNYDRPAMQDPNIRKALEQSVDTNVLNERIWQGIGSPSRAVAPPQSLLAPTVPAVEFDQAAAVKLSDEAAATGWDKRFELTLNATPGNVNQGIIQEGMAKNAGIAMTRREYQIGEYIQRVRIQENYEGIMGAVFYQDACPWCYYGIWQTGSPSNYMNYTSPELDAALGKLRAAQGQDQLKEAMNGLQTVWNDEMPAAINGYLQLGYVVAERAHGVRLGTGYLDLYLEQAYLS